MSEVIGLDYWIVCFEVLMGKSLDWLCKGGGYDGGRGYVLRWEIYPFSYSSRASIKLLFGDNVSSSIEGLRYWGG